MTSKPRKLAPSRREIVLAVGGIVVAVFTMEILLRVWLSGFSSDEQFRRYSLYTEVSPRDMQWSPHPYLNYYPTPDYRRGLTYHNSLGYRSEELELPKPESIYRIVTLGGSTTYTVKVEDNRETFPYQLERILNEAAPQPRIEVVNAGVTGYNSWESLINLQFRVLDLEPDLVLVYHGTNDVHARLVAPGAYRGDNSGRRKQWAPPAISLLERSVLLRIPSRKLGWTHQVGIGSFVDALTFRGADGSDGWSAEEARAGELLRENPAVFFERNLSHMAITGREHGIDVMLVSWAHSPHFGDYASTEVYRSGFRENNAVVERVARKHGTHFFDFAALMPEDTRYWSDGRHVNEAGALLKARLFADYIQKTELVVASGTRAGGMRTR